MPDERQDDETLDQVLCLNETLVETYGPLSNYMDVLAMHVKYDMPRPAEPQLLSDEDFEYRLKFLREELDEFERDHRAGNLTGAIDGLVDLVVVAMGTAVWMGVPWQGCWNEVHRANMSKVLGPTKRGHRCDLQKPEGWQPPDHELVLFGWGKALKEHRRLKDQLKQTGADEE